MILKKMSKMGLALILGGIFVSACGRTSEIKKGWNTYLNAEHGYSFAYPSECFFGPMPSDCKQKPPEERRQECLCFLNGENPDEVFIQAFLGKTDQLSLATFFVSHYDTPMYHPPQGTELASWVKEGFQEMFAEIPDEPNMVINGVPAVRLHSPQSPMAPSFEEIYFIHNDVLLRISMLDVNNEVNKELYEQTLASFILEE
ncbi:MAG: hypothetical protein MUO58_11135 [Anaerolineales bacterium]|nr:hypothetical protein [Anaerolineales bacterium]